MIKKVILSVAMVVALANCAGYQEVEEPVQPPTILADMPLEQAVKAGIQHGDRTLRQVKKLIKRRNQWPEASKVVYQHVRDHFDTIKANQMINAMHLYLAWPQYGQVEMFRLLTQDDRVLMRQLGWQLGSLVRNKGMLKEVQTALETAVRRDQIDRILVPQMANTVERHKLRDSYTLMRMGLFETNHEDFAKAMVSLDPQQASKDFLDYLAQAGRDELRQMTLSTVNIYSCLIALKHLQNNPVEISHPQLGHLFLYAISRNPALVELSSAILTEYVPAYTDHMAFKLAQHPGWVQMAFVEGARRNMTPKLGLILSELKYATSQRDVIDEIAMLRR